MRKRIFAGIIAAAMTVSVIPNVFADEIDEMYDEIMFVNTCDTELEGVTLNEGAPDGSGYYTTGPEYPDNNSNEFRGLGGLSEDTYEDYMWEADVRFDSNGAGFTVKDVRDRKVDTCVRRYDGEDGIPRLAIQTGSTAYDEYDEIDPEAWYHISILGQFGTSAPMKMELYKWEDGELVFVNEYDNINKRNNVAAAYIAVQANTSVDNIRITKLGADELVLSTLPEGTVEINANTSVQMQFSALRNGRDINSPEVEWQVLENGSDITDGSVTITAEGEVSAAADCPDKTVTVKAVSLEKGNVEGSYELSINAVDMDSEKFDTLFLSAERDYVREGGPLSLTVSAEKNGEPVELADGDVVWKFYNEDNIQDTGNRYIRVDNNVLYVDRRVVSQDIVLRAESPSGVVSASLPVTVKASDAVEADETGTTDRLLMSDACEDIVEDVSVNSGSWDGSHYYSVSSEYDMQSVEETSDDVLIEADIKFTEENSGIKLRNSGNTREGGQIARQGGEIGRVGSGNSFLAFSSGDAESWYHIEIIARCGVDSSYGRVYIYKYDENGELVHPDTNEAGEAVEGDLDLRTMSSQLFHHIQVQPGTGIDNVRILRLVPDEVRLSLSADTVFAGGTVQGTCTVYRDGIELPSFPASRLEWAVYDAEDRYPADTELITVDGSGLVSVDAMAEEQTVYIRVTSPESGEYQSLPLNIRGSDIFTVTGLGTNDDGNIIQELRVEKNFFYDGDVSFIVAAYDESGALAGIAVRSMRDNTLAVGENKIDIEDIVLPENFAEVKAMVWTSL